MQRAPASYVSIPSAPAQQAMVENVVGIREPNVRNRDELASMVNNYVQDQALKSNPINTTKSWDATDYFCAAFTFACCFCCSTYKNNPTQITFVKDFYGHVMADTAALGAHPSWGKTGLGKLDFQQLDEKNYSGSYGNVHFVYVPQGQYAKVTLDGQPSLLNAGYHVYVASQFQIHGLTPTNSEIIQHGNTTVFHIPPGCVYVLNDPTKENKEDQIEILEQGRYVRTSRSMKFVKLPFGVVDLYPVEEEIMTSDNYQLGIIANAHITIKTVKSLVGGLGFSMDLPARAKALITNQVEAAFQDAVAQSTYRTHVDYSLSKVQEPSQEGQVQARGDEIELTSVATSSVIGSSSSKALVNPGSKEEDSIKQSVRDKVLEQLERLQKFGISCDDVQVNRLLPDKSTIKMLEDANRSSVTQKTQLSAAKFAAKQTAITTEAEVQAKLKVAGADATAAKIRAKGLKEASEMSDISNELEMTAAVGQALSRVSANVTFYSTDVAPLALFRNALAQPTSALVSQAQQMPAPSAPGAETEIHQQVPHR
jgi:regulator of protease activity HflC (stomatin/prohibitin superfamily)